MTNQRWKHRVWFPAVDWCWDGPHWWPNNRGFRQLQEERKKITRLRNHNQPTTWKSIRQNILRRIKSSWKIKIWANTRQTTVIFRLYFKVISRQWKYTRTYQVIYIYIYISSTFDTYLKCLSHSLGGLHICNLWILLKENVIYLVGPTFYLRGLFCCWSRRKWRHIRNLLRAKTHSYRHTENISLDSESNRYYSMKINRNCQTYGVFVY